MKPRVLIAFIDVYAYKNTSDILQEEFSEELDGVKTVWEQNVADAISRLERDAYQLLIVDLYIPKDQNQAVDEKANNGLEMLKSLKEKGTPSLLVVPTWTRELQEEVDSLDRCRMVPEGSRYTEQLRKFSRLFLLETPDQSDEKAGYIDLSLDLHRNLWQFKISGEFGDSNYLNEGMLEIHPDMMTGLANRSRKVHVDNWETEIEDIGKTLCKEIIENNIIFMRGFYKLFGKIDKQDKIRVRFAVDKKIHPVLLEALIEDNSFLMLNSPVYRKLSVEGEYHSAFSQLGKNRPPVNCLIIESDFRGRAEEIAPGVEFLRLDYITQEALWLHDLLKDNKKEFNIGEIEWVRVDPAHESLLDHLRTILNPNKRWELVHYAGHSYFDDKHGKGYLLFPHDKSVDIIRLQDFSKWLRDCGTQLVFLSSCHSSEEDFVFELAANRIPSIIGFRWDIDDEKAFLCAQKFYTHLLKEGRTLEYAFLETRRDMYKKYPDNQIWAAPMLIMQEK